MDETRKVGLENAMFAYLMAIIAAICWGLAPVAAKLALHQVSPLIGMGVRSIIAAGIMLVWLLATGDFQLVMGIGPRTAKWLVIEALLATVVGDAFYFYALKHGQATHVSLIMSASPLVTLISAELLLREPMTREKLIGAALVMGGLILVGL